MDRKSLISLAAVALAAGLMVSAAQANTDNLLASFSATDGGTASLSSTDGAISSSRTVTVGNFAVTSFSANSNALTATSMDQISASSISITNNGSSTDTLTLDLSDVFNPPGDAGVLQNTGTVTFTLGSSSSDSVTLQGFAGTTESDIVTVDGSSAPSSVPVAVSPTNPAISVTGLQPHYTLESQLTADLASGDSVQITLTSELTVPEPSCLVLLGVGSLGLMLAARKRKPG